MKELIWTLFLILPALALPSNKNCLQSQMLKQRSSKLCPYFSENELGFTINMTRHLYAQRTGNIFFSPFSIYHALLLAYFIANGETSNSLEKLLGFPRYNTKEDTLWKYKVNRQCYKKKPKDCNDCVEFAMANQFYVASTEKVLPCMKGQFSGEIKRINFTNSPEDKINKFVSNITMGQIEDFITPGSIDPNAKIALVNAAYFKGTWKSVFEKEDTSDEIFNTSETDSYTIKMMQQQSKFKYAHSSFLNGTQIVELPYLGELFSMYILLPPVGTYNLSNLLSNLSPSILIDLIEKEPVLKTVNIKLPRFNLERKINLESILKLMDVGDLFEDTSNLSGLTGKSDIHFNKGIHRAKISVDEEGTTAAAATSMFSLRSIPPRIDDFHCNRPFLYFIYHHLTKNIIFIGIYSKPAEKFKNRETTPEPENEND